MYQCDICQKVFATQSSYKDHKLLHKPCNYKCHKCDKKFVYHGGLRIHRNFHNRTWKYICKAEGCFCRYKWRQDILRHTKIHSQETLYACANIAHMRPICTDVMLFYTLQGCHTSVENVWNILSTQCNAINMRKHAIKYFIVISPIRDNY